MTTTKKPAEGAPAVYQAALPLSSKTVTFVADLLRDHLKVIGSRWRKLPAAKIAVIVLAVLRHDQRLADMAGGNDVSPSTVRRWVSEVLWISAARPGRSSDITTARHNHLAQKLRDAGLGAGRPRLRRPGRRQRQPDRHHRIQSRPRQAPHSRPKAGQPADRQRTRPGRARLRHLKNWRILTKLRLNAARATMLLRALLVLTTSEITR
ncbi:hypothetical protein ACFPOI_33640 [Nonomuraea angiospora]|uniref:Transposase n=1 Tax=Nonomuraea angiospora TaxID=46172 RepID=A0ABR9LU49_9ACTN|nr:hypothetical protein [Nonomuraea angiospora]MBE1583783.1 hypothetical protein [Nonomuraea angiospora]